MNNFLLSPEAQKFVYYRESNPELIVMLGDCLEIIPLLPKVDLVITSPPYNLGGDFHTMSKGKRVSYGDYGACGDNMSEPDYQEWQTEFLDTVYHQLTETGNLFYNHKNRLKDFELISPLKWIFRSCLMLRQEIVWDSTNEMNYDKRRFTPCHEKIYWLSKTKTHLNNKNALQDCWVFRNKIKRSESNHPATYPKDIVLNLIDVAENNKGLILDPFLGSGTTLITSKELGRNAIGIEISEKYCEIAKLRLINTQRSLL